MRLYLVRHGETDWNKEGRVQGRSDQELSPLGLRQAQFLGEALRAEPIAAVYSSPLRRAFETAEAIARFHSLCVEPEEGLVEMDHGHLDGLLMEDMRRDYGGFLEEWRVESADLHVPGGESLVELQARAWAAVEGILGRHPQDTVVAVSHFFAIITIIAKALNLDLAYARRLRQDLGALSILDFGERGPALSRLNDSHHLSSGSL